MSEEQYISKCILIGDSGVGKSALMNWYIRKKPCNSSIPSTIGVEFSSDIIKFDDKWLRLHIWDTAGQEKFRSVTRSYYKGADMAICVFDITRRDSFDNLDTWISECRELSLSQTDVPIIIVANKMDLDESSHSVTEDEIIEKSNKYQCKYFMTSSMNGKNVDACFLYISRFLMDAHIETEPDISQDADTVSLWGYSTQYFGGCAC